MNKLPKYINCKNEEVEICEWYMHKKCRETCAYAREIRGMGVGAVCDGGLIKRIEMEQKTHKRAIM